MATELLPSLRATLAAKLPSLALGERGLRATLVLAYGPVPLHIDHDAEAEALRVSVRLPAPPGAGPAFLIWCLALNAQYWDVKIALDEAGFLLVHADLDAPSHVDMPRLSVTLIDRIDTIGTLIDEDLRAHLLVERLGTPDQIARWRAGSAV